MSLIPLPGWCSGHWIKPELQLLVQLVQGCRPLQQLVLSFRLLCLNSRSLLRLNFRMMLPRAQHPRSTGAHRGKFAPDIKKVKLNFQSNYYFSTCMYLRTLIWFCKKMCIELYSPLPFCRRNIPCYYTSLLEGRDHFQGSLQGEKQN